MDRLTKRTKYGMAYTVIPLNESHIGFQCFTGFIADRLADYEDLGTLEEIKQAREKQIPKKTSKTDMEFKALDVDNKEVIMYECAPCPSCEKWITKIYKYCPHCGQRIEE